MHPGFISWWKSERCGSRRWAVAGGAPYEEGWAPRSWRYHASPEEERGSFGGGSLGVRRPLRFLAYKLQLEESQVSELARILSELKTERAQAEVDHRRTLAAFADAVAGESFDDARAGEGATQRGKSAERVSAAVVTALERIHKVLTPEQRSRLAYFIRTGILTL